MGKLDWTYSQDCDVLLANLSILFHCLILKTSVSRTRRDCQNEIELLVVQATEVP